MNLISYLVLALVLGIQALVALRNSAAANPVQLTRGLLISLILSVAFTLLMVAGMLVGDLLCFEFPQTDKAICAGLLVLVVVRQFFSLRRTAVTAYSLERLSAVLMLAIALGINVLLIGLGIGFVCQWPADLWKMALLAQPMVFLMGMWGIMLGRKKIDIRPRRWLYISLLALLVVALVSLR